MRVTTIRNLDAGDIFDFGGERYILEDDDIYNARRFGSGGRAFFSQSTPVSRVFFEEIEIKEEV